VKKKQKKMENIEFKKITAVLTYTIGFFIFVYLITALFMGELNFERNKLPNQTPNVSIQYKEILAGETFNRPEQEYYVIFYKFDDTDAAIINNLSNQYSQKENALKIHIVDLGKKFNKSIYSETIKNLNANNIVDLRLQDITLIKIKNGQNILQVEGLSFIMEYLSK